MILLICFCIFTGFLSAYTVSFLINKNKELFKAKKQISRKLSFFIFFAIIIVVVASSFFVSNIFHRTLSDFFLLIPFFIIFISLFTFLTFMIVYKDSIPTDVPSRKVRKVKKTIYLLLLLFLGFIGAHRFYSKNYKRAFLMLILSFLSFGIFIIRTMITNIMMRSELMFQEKYPNVDWSRVQNDNAIFLQALQGPFGGLLMILTLCPLITLIIYDFLQIMPKKADENGYIDI